MSQELSPQYLTHHIVLAVSAMIELVNALAYWLIGLDELPSKYRVSLMSFFCDKIMIRHLPGKLMGGSYGTDQNNAH